MSALAIPMPNGTIRTARIRGAPPDLATAWLVAILVGSVLFGLLAAWFAMQGHPLPIPRDIPR